MNVTVRNAITSMRLMSAVDWAELFESVSLVDATLRADSDFAEMDFPTRDRYRHASGESREARSTRSSRCRSPRDPRDPTREGSALQRRRGERAPRAGSRLLPDLGHRERRAGAGIPCPAQPLARARGRERACPAISERSRSSPR